MWQIKKLRFYKVSMVLNFIILKCFQLSVGLIVNIINNCY